MNNNGIFRGNNVIKYSGEESVVKLNAGDRIRLAEEQFDQPATAFFDAIEEKFSENF